MPRPASRSPPSRYATASESPSWRCLATRAGAPRPDSSWSGHVTSDTEPPTCRSRTAERRPTAAPSATAHVDARLAARGAAGRLGLHRQWARGGRLQRHRRRSFIDRADGRLACRRGVPRDHAGQSGRRRERAQRPALLDRTPGRRRGRAPRLPRRRAGAPVRPLDGRRDLAGAGAAPARSSSPRCSCTARGAGQTHTWPPCSIRGVDSPRQWGLWPYGSTCSSGR